MLAVLIFCGKAYGHSELPRSLALKDIDGSIARVRQDINAPHIEWVLIDALAGPVGDDPRIVPLCREIIEKSTNTENARHAVEALEVIADRHMGIFGRSKRKAAIAEALRFALRRTDFPTKYRAARLLHSLGGSYADDAYQFWADFLKNDQLSQESPDRRREEYCNSIQESLSFNRTELYSDIRRLINRYDLLSFYQHKVESEQNPTQRASEEKFLARLKELAQDK